MNTRQLSIGDMLQAADTAEDLDKLYLQAYCINIVNAAVKRLGNRENWTVDDARRLAAVMSIVSGIEPVRTTYNPPGTRTPQSEPTGRVEDLATIPLRGGEGDAISRLHNLASDANDEERNRHATLRSTRAGHHDRA